MTTKQVPPFSEAMLVALASAPRWWLGLSGGCDSVALLHMLRRLPDADTKLNACHVNHGLSPHADDWAAFCAQLCAEYNVALVTEQVTLNGEGNLEARARDARYAVFSGLIRPGDALLTAHHQDDQAETVLLRLMRGAGVRGLRGMQRKRGFAQGVHLRPLLGERRAEINAYARDNALSWVEDEGNQAARFDRNHVRASVLPSLQARWPGAAASLCDSARWCAEADQLSQELGRLDLAACRSDLAPGWMDLAVPIDLAGWCSLSEVRQRNMVQVWLRQLVHYPLPKARLQEWMRQLGEAEANATPELNHEGIVLRAYQGSLHCVPRIDASDWATPLCAQRAGGWVLATLESNGWRWVLEAHGDDRIIETLRACWRAGGETVTWPNKAGSVLKKQLQEARIPPWERKGLPLVCAEQVILWSVWFGESLEKQNSSSYRNIDFRITKSPADPADAGRGSLMPSNF